MEHPPLPKRLRSEYDAPDGRDIGHQAFPSSGKPKPCMKFFSTSGCPFGDSCHFLHHVPGGLSSLGMSPVALLCTASVPALQKKAPPGAVGDPSMMVNGYKTKLCNRFNTPEGCRFGDQCHFAHGPIDLRRPNNGAYRGNRQPMINGPGTGYGNGYVFPNHTGYSAPSGSASGFTPQAYVEHNPPSSVIAGNDSGPVTYPTGTVGENVPVY